MIFTLYLLLILAYIIVISPKSLTTVLQQNTQHSATIQIYFVFVTSVYYLFLKS